MIYFKLDFAKAYDKMSWIYFFMLPKARSFCRIHENGPTFFQGC